MWEALICSLAAFAMLGAAGETEVVCVSPEYAAAVDMEHALGWYNGYEDRAYVVEGLSYGYTQEVLWHELAHAWDLKKGTEVNGYPSFFSETHTAFDLEQFARLQTLWLGVFPEDEVYHDTVPTDGEWRKMYAAGWLMDKES